MLYLIAATILYTAAVLVGASASRNGNTNFISLFINGVSVIVPFLIVLPKLAKPAVLASKYAVGMSILGGLLIGLYVVVLSKAFTLNKIGIITPIVYGGTILLSTVLSYFIYKEKISGVEGLGLMLVLIGLSVIIYARATTT